jgi:hypothetical protein
MSWRSSVFSLFQQCWCATLLSIEWWLAAPHYLVLEVVADEIIFETVKNNDLPCLRRKGRCA